MRNAVLNAVNNALRKKGSKFMDLWKRKQRAINQELATSHVEILLKVEEREGKSWVDAIYQANNLRKPERKEEMNE